MEQVGTMDKNSEATGDSNKESDVSSSAGSNNQMITAVRWLRNNPRRTVTILILVFSGAILGIFLYFAGINARIADERAAVEEAAKVEVLVTRLVAPETKGFTCYLNSANVRAVVDYNGTTFLATSGGLIELGDSGSVKRRYTTLDGLPDNDLTSLAVFRGLLFIGSGSKGLLSFDGQSFVNYQFIKPKATRVSVLSSTDSELLVGTLGGGVFEFDGERFSRRYNNLTAADFKNITALLFLDGRLYVGTQDQGLYVSREGRIEHVGTNEGLPSPNVTGLAPLATEQGVIAIATDFAVVGLTDGNEINQLSNRANVTSLGWSGGRLWAGLFTGEIVEIVNARKSFAVSPTGAESHAEVTGIPKDVPAFVSGLSGTLWVLTQQGAFVRREQSSRPGFESIASELVGGRVV
jgi:ligand-binding sensor domain-containing protein